MHQNEAITMWLSLITLAIFVENFFIIYNIYYFCDWIYTTKWKHLKITAS